MRGKAGMRYVGRGLIVCAPAHAGGEKCQNPNIPNLSKLDTRLQPQTAVSRAMIVTSSGLLTYTDKQTPLLRSVACFCAANTRSEMGSALEGERSLMQRLRSCPGRVKGKDCWNQILQKSSNIYKIERETIFGSCECIHVSVFM